MKKLLLLLLLCLCAIPRTMAYTVYFDASGTDVAQPYVYMWLNNTVSTGIVKMNPVNGINNLFSYTWDKTPIGLIFLKDSDWGNNGSNKLTGDVTTNINDGCVYSGGNYKGMYEDLYGGQNDSKLVWYTPADAEMTDEITLYYNANNGNAPFKENKGAKQLYIYPGADTNAKNEAITGWEFTKWSNTSEYPEDCKMTYDAEKDLYSIKFIPKTFFKVEVANANVFINKLYASFRLQDSNVVGGDDEGNFIEMEFGPEIIVPSADRVVYFKSPWGDKPVRAYVYIGAGATSEEPILGAWPGATMALIQDNWYTVTVPGAKIPNDVVPQIILSTDNEQYPANGQGGVAMNFENVGWATFEDFKAGTWHAEKPDGPFKNDYDGYEFDGVTVTVKTSNKHIFITPYSDEIVKVFSLPASPADDFVKEERESISVVDGLLPAANSVLTESDIDDTDEADLVISLGATTVYVSKITGAIRYKDQYGTEMLREAGGLNNNATTVRSLSFAGMREDALYGGGYFGQTNQDGKSIIMTNTQTGNWPGSGGYNHNICIPFYVSTNGYGVYVDDHYIGATLSLSSAGGSSYSTGSRNPIAYYYIGGGSMERVLENYTYLTGRQPMPPYWALGYITSRYGYVSRTQATNVINRLKDECKLPLDAIVLDIYWQGRDGTTPSYMGKLDWDYEAFPQPEEMMKEWKEKKNVNTILITEPYFTSHNATENYNHLKENGFLSDEHVSANDNMSWLGGKENGPHIGLLDVTKQGAIDWMSEYYKKHTKSGVASWWLDLGEPEGHDDDSRYEKGDKNQVHNEYGQRWLAFAYEATKKAFEEKTAGGERFIMMPRSATAGMQRYAACPWTGDIARSWDGLRVQIPALLSSGMSGVAYMGSDVGGFIHSGVSLPNLYQRWVQFAVFSPAMRTHSQTPKTLTDEDGDSEGGAEPFNYPGILDNVRDMINKRYKYLPYTYTLAYENATKGWPLARPSNFYMPTEGDLASCDTQYLWGKDLLVAPVTEQNATTKTVIFPEGKWMNLNDYSKVYGSQSMTARENVAAPADELPHFARLGSVIPCYTQDTFTSTEEIDRSKMTLMYFYDDENPAVSSYYYDDDHKSPTSIADGNYCITRMEANEASTSRWLTISYEGKPDEILPEEMTYTIIIPKYGNHVSAEGLCVIRKSDSQQSARGIRASRPQEKVTMASTKNEFDNTTENVAYRDGTDLYIKVQRRRGDTMVQPHFNETTTSIDDIEAVADRLSICAMGTADDLTLRYYVPVDGISAEVSLVAASGMTVASVADAEADKGAHLLNVGGVTPGIYVAHVKVATANGSSIGTSEKIIVR